MSYTNAAANSSSLKTNRYSQWDRDECLVAAPRPLVNLLCLSTELRDGASARRFMNENWLWMLCRDCDTRGCFHGLDFDY